MDLPFWYRNSKSKISDQSDGVQRACRSEVRIGIRAEQCPLPSLPQRFENGERYPLRKFTPNFTPSNDTNGRPARIRSSYHKQGSHTAHEKKHTRDVSPAPSCFVPFLHLVKTLFSPNASLDLAGSSGFDLFRKSEYWQPS